MDRMRMEAALADITEQDVDAIVNAANSHLAHGGGVAAAIAGAAGSELERASAEHPEVPVGEAAWTTAGNLKARWVIHAVGPVWSGGGQGEPELLAGAYRSALRVAGELGARSIAFPSISTGIYGFPLHQAAAIAVDAVRDASDDHASVELIRFCLFSDGDLAAYREALNAE
jgi:O-acetyl-ADP-ribose deacetylase (regulator of RNase III)